ncbi:kinase C-binding NELL2-like protein [Labeo rohita]|uniref:NEL-like protein 2 n=1 Tax=Labeo rohita TaxID=84645 RepID=A0A498MRW8_LABRO|nr:kinase C-binding NELL2-like protein [Labeo rohita]
MGNIASGFGVDPALHVDIFQEFDLVKSNAGVSQVQGFHNESRAYLFEDQLWCPLRIVEVTRFLEVESSGLRNEIRLFFQTSDQRQQREVFPYSLADGHWHKVSLAFSATQVVLHIDCNRIYERIVETPSMDFPRGTNIWLGQRNDAHGFFRGVMQDVQLVVIPHGYIVQCPDLNRTCPTCNDFHGLVQKIMELQDILAKTSSKDRRHDFCAEGHSRNCVENSDCINLEAGAFCSCKEGYHALRDDSAYCQDIDECAEGKHYCRENTMCMNTPGSFMCVCNTGYVRIDDYSCTEHDECVRGLNTCDENALCFNTVGGHSCSCKPGYVGNGTVCRALCEGQCLNGGSCVSPDTCVCQQGFTGKRCETDIDECSDGFVECDSRATCVNLPGWYHCECRDGYHDNGMFSANGESCEDIDECETGRHSCANDTVCFNVDGGYDCRCPHGRNCTGDCAHDGKVKHNGQIWVLDDDRCSVCSCQSGLVMCRRMVCDCENPTVDVLCCPECDPRLSSQCLHQNGLLAYSNGETWVENCQQCQCMRGEVDCWPISCAPVADCEFTVVPEGECCPRCVTDPCLADTVRNDITKTCVDEYGITRFSGSAWTKHGTECSLCQCKGDFFNILSRVNR